MGYKGEIELNLQVLTGVSTSSPDEVMASTLPSPPDEHRQYQELLQRVTNDMQSPLEDIKDTPHWLPDILKRSVSSSVVSP